MKTTQTTFPLTPTGPHLPALLLQPKDPLALMLFGHGAGTPMRAPLMHQIAQALAHHRIATFSYDYPYSHRLQDGYTQDLIDPLEVLLQTTRAAIQAAQNLVPDLPFFLAGRSMSGQVMSLLLAREPLPHVRGLICYVYPTRWHALLPDTLAHLPHVPVPTLFIQGARDPEYSDLTELQTVIGHIRNAGGLNPSPGGEGQGEGSSGQPTLKAASTFGPAALHPLLGERQIRASSAEIGEGSSGRDRSQTTESVSAEIPREPALSLSKGPVSNHTLHVIKDADHSFHLPPQSTRTQQDAIEEAATTTATWIHQQLEAPTDRSR